MREAILFPERYSGDLGAATSGIGAPSSVRFTETHTHNVSIQMSKTDKRWSMSSAE